MSALTWDALSGSPSHAGRQRQRRRVATIKPVKLDPRQVVVVPADFNPHADANVAKRRARQRTIAGIVLAGTAVAVLHAAIATLWKNVPATPLPKQEKVIVELVKPKEPEPEIEPPKPLQQKVAPRPKVLPRVVPQQQPRPAPAPVAKNEPVAPDTPTIAVPPALPAPPAPAPVQETVTEAIGYAGYLHNPPPVYPANAQRLGLEGKVLLRVRVLASGKPASVEVQSSSGRKILDEAAVNTVQNWLFAPARRGQTPVDGWATVPIEFKLERS